MLSKREVALSIQWVNEIWQALKQGDLKKLNGIIKSIPSEKLREVLNTKVKEKWYMLWNTPLVAIIHRLDYQTIHYGLDNLPDRLEKQSPIAFFSQVLDQINYRVDLKYHGTQTWPNAHLYPYLYECACWPTFNRTTCSRRNNIENEIIAETRKRFSTLNNRQLNYLSFGSGYLLQDFILLFKFILIGYSLKITLIERNSETDDFQNALMQLHLLVYAAGEKDLSFQVQSFSRIQDYVSQAGNETIDVAHAIDMPTLPIDDLSIVYYKLGDQGFLYMADHFHNFFCTHSQIFFSNKFKLEFPGIYYEDSQADYKEIQAFPRYAKVIEEDLRKNINQDMVVSSVLSYLGLFRKNNKSVDQHFIEAKPLKVVHGRH